MKDLYEILEISGEATPLEIKKAYRRLALKYHPDRVPEEEKKESGERFKEVSRAYAILSDPGKRAYYDKFGYTEDEPIVLSEVLQKFKEDISEALHPETLEDKIPHFENLRSIDGKVVATCSVCEGSGTVVKPKGFLLVEKTCETCKGSGYTVLWAKPVEKRKEPSWDFLNIFGLK